MKNILLLTDFSENAKTAIIYSLELFRDESINFNILNVQKVSNYTTADLITASPRSSVYKAVIQDHKTKLSSMLEELTKGYQEEAFVFNIDCDYDDFISAVKQQVKLKTIDLIIMGTNGATAAKEVIFGSNTLHVIRNVDCPVLVIPDQYTFSKPYSILFVTEAKEVISKQALKPMLDLIHKFNTEVHVLLLEKDENRMGYNEKKEAIDIVLTGVEHNFYTMTNIPADIAIDSFVQIQKVDLSAKLVNKKTFLKRLLTGSKTDEITYKTRVPLLIMHP
tara:strand:- start:83318 stop:84151 length:834 start_codon:yes stop_codon:yes gene_type:complete